MIDTLLALAVLVLLLISHITWRAIMVLNERVHPPEGDEGGGVEVFIPEDATQRPPDRRC